MKKHVLCLILILVNLEISAQTPLIDSLRTIYQQQSDSEQSIRHHFTFAKAFIRSYPDSAIYHAELIIRASRKIGFLKGEAFAQEIISQSKHNKGEYELAVEAHQMHYDIQMRMKDTLTAGMVLQQKGQEYSEWGYPDKAMEDYFSALKIYERYDSHDNIGSIYNDIGAVLREQGRFKEALDYFKKGFYIRKKYSTEDKFYYSYSNLSNVFDDMGKYDSSFYYANLAVQVAIKYEDHISEAIQYVNMGYSHRKLEHYYQAESYYLKALDILKDSPYNDYLITLYINLGTVADFSGQYQKALFYLDQSRPFVEKTSALDLKKDVAETYSSIYKNLNDYKKAFDFLNQARVIADSINDQVNNEKVAELNIKYQTQKKETDLARNRFELERQSRQKYRILLGGIIVVLLLISVFLFLRYRLQLRRQQAELNLQLEKAQAEKLRDMDRIKSNFFTNISHEFRTPLTLILGPLRQMREGSFKGNTTKYMDIMIRNGERLMNLVNQLLDLSKLEGGKMSLNLEQGDLVKTLKAMVYAFESLAERQEINLEVNIPDARITAWFDKDKLEKVMINLLSNAFKYTPERGTVCLEFELRDNGQKEGENIAVIRVKDTGMGIPQDQLPMIFERFFQTTNVSEMQAGSGIGLALSKELVELHNGTILVESEVDKGTVFIIELPVGKAVLESGSAQPGKNILVQTGEYHPGDETVETGGKTRKDQPMVLLVEDNADVRTYVKEQLEGQYNVVEAKDGEAGVEKAIQLIPDLIISDVMMPKMNGMELCKTLKANDKTSHIPIIMLTAKAEQEDKIEGLQLGADDYLMKPFDARELNVRIQNLIEQRRRLQKSFGTEFTFHPESVEVSSVDETFLLKVKSTIEENLDDETFSVEDLSQSVGMSRSQLHRKLKAMTNQSPNEIIRVMRLLRAKELLEKKAGNASEIAFMVGFNSLAYFSKCYRDHFGVPPSEVG
ncbi:MAG: response regulator [Lewinellaceae bacterium]|nr:response regulator [Lewinellaceae bacterium]